MDLMNWLRIRPAKPIIAGPTIDMEMQGDMYGNTMVAAGMPERAALSAAGDSYVVEDTTARACVIAMPTTASLFGLWNGEDPGGKSYVIDRIGATFIAQTATTAWAARVIANMTRKAVAAPSSLVSPFPVNGALNYCGKGYAIATPTAVATDGWFGLGPSASCPAGVTVNPGAGLDIPINGALIIRPQRQLCLSAIGTATAVTVLLSIWYHELQMQLGS